MHTEFERKRLYQEAEHARLQQEAKQQRNSGDVVGKRKRNRKSTPRDKRARKSR